jgi:hypothetical protein
MERQISEDRRTGERRASGDRRMHNRRISPSLFSDMEIVETTDMNDSVQERRSDERRGGAWRAGERRVRERRSSYVH